MHPEIDIESIKSGLPGITVAWATLLVEACMVCLCRSKHDTGVLISVDNNNSAYYRLNWSCLMTDQIERSWKDQEEATEHAAVCIAVHLALRLTDFTIIERSAKKTGFDYWLGEEGESELSFEKKARLEISGIFNGDASKVKTRYNGKVEQTKQSAALNIPAYVAIVEFSYPMAKFGTFI